MNLQLNLLLNHLIFVIKFVECRKVADLTLFFFLIIILYVLKCFRGVTCPEVPSYTLMNKCTKFGAFMHYAHIIFLSHLKVSNSVAFVTSFVVVAVPGTGWQLQ